MNRRDFFEKFTKGILGASGAVIAGEAAAMIAHSSKTSIARAVNAGSPAAYFPNSLTYIETAQAWLGRDSLGFYALDAHCTHLGCLIQHDSEKFTCPCHGSAFQENGAVINGPAVRPLRYLLVELNDENQLLINRTKMVDPQERLIA